jgi:hypothetical protein
MPIRLVALATADGSPKNISKGKVISDPPPATTLRNPATTPAAITIMASVSSMCWAKYKDNK